MESCHVRLGDNLLLEESYPQGQDEEWITSQWGEGGGGFSTQKSQVSEEKWLVDYMKTTCGDAIVFEIMSVSFWLHRKPCHRRLFEM